MDNVTQVILTRIARALEGIEEALTQKKSDEAKPVSSVSIAPPFPYSPPRYLSGKWPRLDGTVYDNTPHGPIPPKNP